MHKIDVLLTSSQPITPFIDTVAIERYTEFGPLLEVPCNRLTGRRQTVIGRPDADRTRTLDDVMREPRR